MRGLITRLRDGLGNVFFGEWDEKQLQLPSDTTQGIGLGFGTTQVLGPDKTLIAPGNYISQVAANKGPVHAGLSLIAKKVGAATLRIYRPKRTASKSILYVTRTRAVPEPRKAELLAKAAAGSVLSLAEDVEEVVGGHRLVTLLTSVNEHYDIYQLQYITAAYLLLTGNCYWVLIKDSLGLPTAIWVAPAEYMRVKPAGNTTIGGYVYRRGQVKLEFEADEVVHFKSPAPGAQFQFYGRGDLMGAIDDFNLLQHMYTFEFGMFQNGGIPATLLSTESEWTEAQRNSYMENWLQRYGGSKNAGRPLVGHNVKVEQLGMSPREMAYQSARKFSNENIYTNMGAPTAMMTSQVNTRAALDASTAQVEIFSIDPMIRLIQQAINAQLIPRYTDPIYVEYDDVVQEDKEFLLRQDTELLKAGAMSINEVRARRGIEPTEGGEVPHIDGNRMKLTDERQPTQAQTNNMATAALREARRRLQGE